MNIEDCLSILQSRAAIHDSTDSIHGAEACEACVRGASCRDTASNAAMTDLAAESHFVGGERLQAGHRGTPEPPLPPLELVDNFCHLQGQRVKVRSFMFF